MKKYLVKRYIESVDPGEMDVMDREYKNSEDEIIDLYQMQDYKKIAAGIYQDEYGTDIYRIKNDENGCYMVTYSCIQDEKIDEEDELFELFRFKLIKLDDNVYESAHDPDMHISEFEECILIVDEAVENQ